MKGERASNPFETTLKVVDMRVVITSAALETRWRHGGSWSIRRLDTGWAKGGGAECDFGGGECGGWVLEVRLCESG